MANGRGGKRPGAGRKPKQVKDWQASNLAILHSVFAPDDVKIAAQALREALKAGDPMAWRYGLSYVFGPPPKELILKGDEEAPLKIKGYLRVSPDDWPTGETDK